MPSKQTRRRRREADTHAPAAGGRTGPPAGTGRRAAQPPRAEKTYARHPASRLTRLYAWTIDASLIVMLVMVLGRTTRGALFSRDAAPQDIFLFLAYFVAPTGIWGRTLGKWVAGIVVVDEKGRTPGVAVAISREVAWKVIAYGLGGLGLLWIVFDKERRGLHDRLAGTYVVRVPDSGVPFLSKLFRVKPRE
jgi:uncharacterized RDD family membrane protein YckC